MPRARALSDWMTGDINRVVSGYRVPDPAVRFQGLEADLIVLSDERSGLASPVVPPFGAPWFCVRIPVRFGGVPTASPVKLHVPLRCAQCVDSFELLSDGCDAHYSTRAALHGGLL